MPIYDIKNKIDTGYDAPILSWNNYNDKISVNNKYGYNFEITLPKIDNVSLKDNYSNLSFSNDRILNKSKIVSSNKKSSTLDNDTIPEAKLANLFPHQYSLWLANPWKTINN